MWQSPPVPHTSPWQGGSPCDVLLVGQDSGGERVQSTGIQGAGGTSSETR